MRFRRVYRSDGTSRILDERAAAHGVSIWKGERPFDRLWGLAGINELVEYKNPETDYGRKGFSDSQRKFIVSWRGAPPRLISTVEDVDREVARMRELGRWMASRMTLMRAQRGMTAA